MSISHRKLNLVTLCGCILGVLTIVSCYQSDEDNSTDYNRSQVLSILTELAENPGEPDAWSFDFDVLCTEMGSDSSLYDSVAYYAQHGESEDIRWWAFTLLGYSKNEESVELLLGGSRSKDWSVTISALGGLERVVRSGVSKKSETMVIDRVKEILSSDPDTLSESDKDVVGKALAIVEPLSIDVDLRDSIRKHLESGVYSPIIESRMTKILELD